MRFYTEYLWFNTEKRREYIRITEQVRKACRKSGIKEGMILVSAMHISAGVFVNDNEAGILQDIDTMLDTLAPFGPDYLHHRTGEDNGDAHLKSILAHHQIIVPVTGETGSGSLAGDLLCRIRRSAQKAGHSESDGRIIFTG